jgi:hypothetical protein
MQEDACTYACMHPIERLVEPCIAVPDIWPAQDNYDYRLKGDLRVQRVEFLLMTRPVCWADIMEDLLDEAEFENTPVPSGKQKPVPDALRRIMEGDNDNDKDANKRSNKAKSQKQRKKKPKSSGRGHFAGPSYQAQLGLI